MDNCLILSKKSSIQAPKERSGQNVKHRHKKTLVEKIQKKHLLISLQKNKSTETSGLVFADSIEQVVKKSKFELGLIKSADCFPDGHDNLISNLVSFQVKS